MNALKHYQWLIIKARNRAEPETKEIHHIIPKSLGGSDDPSNLVALTPKEHCLAHMLLLKIYPDSIEMKCAYNFMCTNGSRHYVETRARVVEALTGRYIDSYTRSKISIGRRWSSTSVQMIEPGTNHVLAIFRSPIDAAESIICDCLRKNDLISTCARLNKNSGTKTSMGFIWKYL